LNEYEVYSLQDTYALVLRYETLESPHILASNSALLSRGGFRDGSRSHHNNRVVDSQGFSFDELECYYCHELGHTMHNFKILLAKKNGSSTRTLAIFDKTATIYAEKYTLYSTVSTDATTIT
jgi:hypothetical protein